jgi:phosphoribosylformylglycinamidine synthase
MLLQSAHDVSEGGLAVALAECCISGPSAPLGARIHLESAMRADILLFGESQSRVILSAKRRNLSELFERARQDDVPLELLGEVRKGELEINEWIDLSVETIQGHWDTSLEKLLGVVE